ncbi:hypothetical protein [Microbacterium sp. NPDC056736]|uniref:hypothetical protein n=1 Tax=Microbacterium sp. NPDC056736 TaxID=3345932 RepID=UPI00366CDBBA
MSWMLYNAGRRRPPRNSKRLLAWAIVVLIVCAALLPFIVLGVIKAFAEGEVIGGISLIVVSALLAWGVVAAVTAMVRASRVRWTR